MTNNQPTWDFSVYDSGFPRQKPDTSTSARQAAVRFENSVRDEAVENGAFFWTDGALVLKRVGQADRVSFSASELARATGSLFTHNHPSGLSFSVPDIQLAIAYRFIEVRAVSPRWRHMMRPIASWPSASSVGVAIQSEMMRANANIHQMLNSGQLSNQFRDLELQHQMWALVSRRLNLEYRREAS